MPWKTKADVARHNKRVARGSAKRRRQWKDIANKGLARGLSEGEALREANGVLARERDRSSSARAERMYGGRK